MPLTVGQIAKALHYSRSRVIKLIQSGELRPLPRTNLRGKYLVDEGEFARFQEWLASQDKGGRIYAHFVANQYVSQLPDTFDPARIEQSLATVASEVNKASLALTSSEHPFQYWSAMLHEIGASLDAVRQSALFRAIVQSDTMNLSPLLKADLRTCIHKLRDSVAAGVDPAMTRDILSFRDMVNEWGEFASQWVDFRDAAASCFTSRHSNEKYGELKHPESVVVYDQKTRRRLMWNAFGLMHEPGVVATMAKWIARVTQNQTWQFDTICSMSAAALQLSSFVAYELGKSVVALDNETFVFQPPDPAGENYVLIDTVCQTGSHLLQSVNRSEEHHKRIAGAVFIALNDMMPEDGNRRRLQLIGEMIRQGRLFYCYDIGHLYGLYSSRPSSSATELS